MPYIGVASILNLGTISHTKSQYATEDEKVVLRKVRSLEHNFSLERAQHLIGLSQWLTEHQHDGFLATPAAHKDNGHKNMNNNETTTFTPGQSLLGALESGSLNRLRSALVAELENNRLDAQTVRQAMKWAGSRATGLFADYEEDTLALGFDSLACLFDHTL